MKRNSSTFIAPRQQDAHYSCVDAVIFIARYKGIKLDYKDVADEIEPVKETANNKMVEFCRDRLGADSWGKGCPETGMSIASIATPSGGNRWVVIVKRTEELTHYYCPYYGRVFKVHNSDPVFSDGVGEWSINFRDLKQLTDPENEINCEKFVFIIGENNNITRILKKQYEETGRTTKIIPREKISVKDKILFAQEIPVNDSDIVWNLLSDKNQFYKLTRLLADSDARAVNDFCEVANNREDKILKTVLESERPDNLIMTFFNKEEAERQIRFMLQGENKDIVLMAGEVEVLIKSEDTDKVKDYLADIDKESIIRIVCMENRKGNRYRRDLLITRDNVYQDWRSGNKGDEISRICELIQEQLQTSDLFMVGATFWGNQLCDIDSSVKSLSRINLEDNHVIVARLIKEVEDFFPDR